METYINDYGIERFTDAQYDNLYQRFKNITMNHVESISDALFETYKVKAASRDIISPEFIKERKYITELTRQEFVSKIISESEEDQDFFNAIIGNNDHEVIGEIEGKSVYFLPKQGIYTWHISHSNVDLILDVWLTWPCFPINYEVSYNPFE